MLMRTDPFRDLDRLTGQLFGGPAGGGTLSRPLAMPMDAYRSGQEYIVEIDLPGVNADEIELDVERNVLTIKAERKLSRVGEDVEMQLAERPSGAFSRQLFLGETLDAENIQAGYDGGVLTLRIPIAEQAKPRRIEVAKSGTERTTITA